jgi:hypothetical protein
LEAEPIATAAVLGGEAAAAAVVLKREAVGTPIASKGEPTLATAAGSRFKIRCNIALVSCRRWIALQEDNAGFVVPSAQQ